jgi:hypothetical protein
VEREDAPRPFGLVGEQGLALALGEVGHGAQRYPVELGGPVGEAVGDAVGGAVVAFGERLQDVVAGGDGPDCACRGVSHVVPARL